MKPYIAKFHSRLGQPEVDTQQYFENVAGWPQSRLSIAYVTGFILSLLFTLAAFTLATHPALIFSLSLPVVAAILGMLALAQFVVQLFFFFHFGRGAAARERFWILMFTLALVGILVSGSIWIMYTLDARMMPSPAQMEQYMNSQTGI